MAKYNINGIEFDELFVDRSITKTPCLYYRNGCKCTPVMYLKKAKGIPDAFYEALIGSLNVKIEEEE